MTGDTVVITTVSTLVDAALSTIVTATVDDVRAKVGTHVLGEGGVPRNAVSCTVFCTQMLHR